MAETETDFELQTKTIRSWINGVSVPQDDLAVELMAWAEYVNNDTHRVTRARRRRRADALLDEIFSDT